MSHEVVISGVGAITHLSDSAGGLHDALTEKKINFTTIDVINGLRLRNSISVGQIPIEKRIELQNNLPLRSFNSALAAQGAAEALNDAGLQNNCGDIGIVLANNDGNIDVLESELGLSPRTYNDAYSSHHILDHIKNKFKITGLATVIHNTCASFNAALAIAVEMIRRGVHDTVLVGATDLLASKVLFGFDTLRALSTNSCRPFCSNRGTITISEGAAFAVVQRSELASRAYCQILAAVRNNDAAHPTAPLHESVRNCHLLALESAGITENDIDVIFAHGTATKANDETEAKIFQELYPKTSIVATKSVLGHTMATCGGVNAVTICKSFERETIPGNLYYGDDLEFDLNISSQQKYIRRNAIIQSNSFGFGGNNAIAIFKGI